MKRLGTRSMWLTVSAALLGTLFFVAPGMGAPNGNVSIDFQETPIRSALETLFSGTGYSYTLEPGAGRPVTVSLRDVPFLGALQATLRSAGLTYSLQDGVYSIKPSDSPGPSGPATYVPPASVPSTVAIELPPAEIRIEKIPLNFADAFDISDMFGSEHYTSRGNAFATSGGSYMSGFGSTGNSGYGTGGLSSYGYGGYGGGNLGGIRSGGYGSYGSSSGGFGSGAYGGFGRAY